jgi:hypothetical protein
VPGHTQSRSSFQPIASNHFNEIVASRLATADADADDLFLSGQTDRDHHILTQGCGVGLFPSRRDLGGRLAGGHEEQREGRAKDSTSALAAMLRRHRRAPNVPADPIVDPLLA